MRLRLGRVVQTVCRSLRSRHAARCAAPTPAPSDAPGLRCRYRSNTLRACAPRHHPAQHLWPHGGGHGHGRCMAASGITLGPRRLGSSARGGAPRILWHPRRRTPPPASRGSAWVRVRGSVIHPCPTRPAPAKAQHTPCGRRLRGAGGVAGLSGMLPYPENAKLSHSRRRGTHPPLPPATHAWKAWKTHKKPCVSHPSHAQHTPATPLHPREEGAENPMKPGFPPLPRRRRGWKGRTDQSKTEVCVCTQRSPRRNR